MVNKDTRIIIPTSEEIAKIEQFNQLKSAIDLSYSNFDIRIAQLAWAAYLHQWSNEPVKVWISIMGPSSSGKTSLITDPINNLGYVTKGPNSSFVGFTTPIDTITEKSFLGAKKGDKGILSSSLYTIDEVRLDKYKFSRPRNSSVQYITEGVLVWGDFSTFLSLDSKIRMVIDSNLRRIHDNSYSSTSTQAYNGWSGAVTIITVCTYTQDMYTRVSADLGERFITIRMAPFQDADNFIKIYRRRAQSKTRTNVNFNQMIKEFLDIEHCISINNNLASKIDDSEDYNQDQYEKVHDLIVLASHLRRSVSRKMSYEHEQDSNRAISGKSALEGFGRLTKQIRAIITRSADMFRREWIHDDDVELGRLAALNCIPPIKLKIMELLKNGEVLPAQKMIEVIEGCSDIHVESAIAQSIEDLVSTHCLVGDNKNLQYANIRLNPKFKETIVDKVTLGDPTDELKMLEETKTDFSTTTKPTTPKNKPRGLSFKSKEEIQRLNEEIARSNEEIVRSRGLED